MLGLLPTRVPCELMPKTTLDVAFIVATFKALAFTVATAAVVAFTVEHVIGIGEPTKLLKNISLADEM